MLFEVKKLSNLQPGEKLKIKKVKRMISEIEYGFLQKGLVDVDWLCDNKGRISAFVMLFINLITFTLSFSSLSLTMFR